MIYLYESKKLYYGHFHYLLTEKELKVGREANNKRKN